MKGAGKMLRSMLVDGEMESMRFCSQSEKSLNGEMLLQGEALMDLGEAK